MLGTEYQVTMLTVLFSLLRALCCYYICYFVIERLPLSLSSRISLLTLSLLLLLADKAAGSRLELNCQQQWLQLLLRRKIV